MLKCENYLTVITNRSRNLIHFHSNRHSPNWEVLFQTAILDPVKELSKRRKIMKMEKLFFNLM